MLTKRKGCPSEDLFNFKWLFLLPETFHVVFSTNLNPLFGFQHTLRGLCVQDGSHASSLSSSEFVCPTEYAVFMQREAL